MGFLNWASGLRFRELFFLTLAVFLLDLFLVDPLPLIDEIFLGLLTLLLGSARKRHDEEQSRPNEIDQS